MNCALAEDADNQCWLWGTTGLTPVGKGQWLPHVETANSSLALQWTQCWSKLRQTSDGISVMTYLRKGKKHCAATLRSKKNAKEIILQRAGPEKEREEVLPVPDQRFPCCPWRIPCWSSLYYCSPCRMMAEQMLTTQAMDLPWRKLQAQGELMQTQAPGKSFSLWKEVPRLEQSFLEGLYPVERNHLEELQFMTSPGAVHEGLSSVRGTLCWRKGKCKEEGAEEMKYYVLTATLIPHPSELLRWERGKKSQQRSWIWVISLSLSWPKMFVMFSPSPAEEEGGSSTVGAWQPAKVNTPFLSYLWALIASLDYGLEGLWNPVYLEGTAGTLITSWNLVLVINAHRQSFDWTDAAWSHSVWQQHKTINFNHP